MKVYQVVILAGLLGIVLTLIFIPSDEVKSYEQMNKDLDSVALIQKENQELLDKAEIDLIQMQKQIDSIDNILKQKQ